MNEITYEIALTFGAVLAMVVVTLLMLSWLAAIVWDWTDDNEGDGLLSPLFDILMTTFGYTYKTNYQEYYHEGNDNYSDGAGPVSILCIIALISPAFLLTISRYPFEMSIPIGVVVMAFSLRSFKRLTKRLSSHISNKDAHKE